MANEKNFTAGAFFLSRSILESELWEKKPAWWFKVFVYILGSVNYTSTKHLERGQGFFSVQQIYSACLLQREGIKQRAVENVLNWLKKEVLITAQKTARGSVITVVNYGKYQKLDNYSNGAKNGTKNGIETEQERDRNGTKTESKRNRNGTITVKKKEGKRKKEILSYEEYEEFSEKFFNFVKGRYLRLFPNTDKATLLDKWGDEFRKLTEIDGLNKAQIEFLINWLFTSESEDSFFWREQIITPAKLRKKNKDGIKYWSVLVDKIHHQNKKGNQKDFLNFREYST